jgi:Domain of unknown function (DUF4115)
MAGHDDSVFETCQIVFWRGYVKCAFYAVPEGGEPVASPLFRSRERSPAQSGAALEAYRALLERLADQGWEPAAQGRAWYALTFQRRDWSPIEELPLEEPPVAMPAVEAHTVPPPPEPEPELGPQPEPAPVAEPEPVAAPAARTSRQQRALIVITAALITLAVALGLTLFGTSSAQGKNRGRVTPAQTRQELLSQHGPAVSAVPAAHRRVKAVPTSIVVTGSRGGSWVEARVGSKTGRSLFAGVVAKGQTVRVTAPVVWITFGAAGNLDLRVNGKAPVQGTFNGTITAVIAHGRVRSA